MDPPRQTTAAVGNKRCWNCRERKTACDKALPSCTNCRRRDIECLGYGLKLSWPRKNDKRRSVHGDHTCIPIRSRKLAFVNASNPDVELWKGERHVVRFADTNLEGAVAQLRRDLRVSRSINLSFMTIRQLDPLHGTDDHFEASRLISSCCDGMRELYPLIIRMSVGDELPPTIATRHALAALSHKLLGDQQTAMMHHSTAVSALQVAIDSLKTAGYSDQACHQKFQAIAASLMLNTFEVSPYGIPPGAARRAGNSAGRLQEPPRGWGIFFNGSKQIAKFMHVPHKTYDGDPALILDWLFYHDTMHKFSLRHWHPQDSDDRGHAYIAAQDPGKVVSKAVFSPQRQMIVLLTGCSIECLDLIHQTIDVVRPRSDPDYLSPSHLAALHRLEYRLTNLVQILRVSASPCLPNTAAADKSTLENRAELFRLAALVYLYRVAWNRPRSDPSVAPLIRDGIRLLKRTIRDPPLSEADPLEPNGERPFPLFVLGVEARMEGERRVMVDAMDAAARARPLGNVAGCARRMVFAAWVRADLHGEGSDEGEGEDRLTVYDALFSGNRMPPFMA